MSIVFNTSFRYAISWYTLRLVNFDSTSTLTSITWLRARKVKQTWRACEPPLPPPPYTAHLDMSTFHITTRETVFLKVGGVLGGLSYLKRCYRLSFVSYPSFFARPLFSLVNPDREPGTKYSDTCFADFALFLLLRSDRRERAAI